MQAQNGRQRQSRGCGEEPEGEAGAEGAEECRRTILKLHRQHEQDIGDTNGHTQHRAKADSVHDSTFQRSVRGLSS